MKLRELLDRTIKYSEITDSQKQAFVEHAIKKSGSQAALAELVGLFPAQISHAKRGLLSEKIFLRIVRAYTEHLAGHGTEGGN